MELDVAENSLSNEQLKAYMKLYQVSFEERDQALRPVAEGGQEAVGSMGDDTPMAVLSRTQRSLYDYFRQQFAQITNPAIDPLREAIVMSLETCLGRELSVYEETEEHANRLILNSPVLSPAKFHALQDVQRPGYEAHTLSLAYDPEQMDLRAAIVDLRQRAESAVQQGKVLLDRKSTRLNSS